MDPELRDVAHDLGINISMLARTAVRGEVRKRERMQKSQVEWDEGWEEEEHWEPGDPTDIVAIFERINELEWDEGWEEEEHWEPGDPTDIVAIFERINERLQRMEREMRTLTVATSEAIDRAANSVAAIGESVMRLHRKFEAFEAVQRVRADVGKIAEGLGGSA